MSNATAIGIEAVAADYIDRSCHSCTTARTDSAWAVAVPIADTTATDKDYSCRMLKVIAANAAHCPSLEDLADLYCLLCYSAEGGQTDC